MFGFIERFKTWADGLYLDFCKWRYLAMGVSRTLFVLSILAFFVIGPNYSTDFTGDTEIRVRFEDPIDIGDLRKSLTELGLPDDAVQAVNGADSGEFGIRIGDPSFGVGEIEAKVRDALATLYGP